MILVCRHGETQWNIQKRKQGRMDSPLTLRGIGQGVVLANKLQELVDLDSSNIVCSPLFRTMQYASIICETNDIMYKRVCFDERLMEHSFGEWEGLNEQEIEERFPGMVKDREHDWWDFVVPSGESYCILEDRLRPFVDDLDPDKNHILITHEMVSKVLRKILFNLSEHACLALGHKHTEIMAIDNGNFEVIKL
jgi:probable phosphoglycerate mutase